MKILFVENHPVFAATVVRQFLSQHVVDVMPDLSSARRALATGSFDVLLVDDILDTGRTMKRVLGKLRPLKPRRIRTCVLLNKAARRVEHVEADYVGFDIPDYFVVGYGLDFAERYRNLPFVGVLHPHVYRLGTGPSKTDGNAG